MKREFALIMLMGPIFRNWSCHRGRRKFYHPGLMKQSVIYMSIHHGDNEDKQV